MDVETTMDKGVKLRINETKIEICNPDEIVIESLRMDRLIDKVVLGGTWGTTLKRKIVKVYSSLNVSPEMADIILKEGLLDAIGELQDQHLDNLEHSDELKEVERAKRVEEENKEINIQAEKFYEFLQEHELTLFGYIEYLSRWFSGGEARNVIIGLLCCFGTFSGVKPLWFMALGKAGEGKSFIEYAVLHLVPTKFQENGLKTPAALIRKGQNVGTDYLNHKCITMGDLGDPKDYEKYRETMHKFKKMTTEGKDEWELVSDSMNPETGQRDVILQELTGYPAVIFTSVNSENVDPQFISRGLTVTPQATDKQVSLYVHYMQSGSIWKKKTDYIIRNHLPLFHGYLQSIDYENSEIINPYYQCLENWYDGDEYFKRALNKYPELVKIITYLHAHEREYIIIDGKKYYISTKKDNMLVAQLVNPSSNLSGVAINVFNKLVELYKDFDEDEMTLYRGGEHDIRQCKTFFSVSSAKQLLKNNRGFRGLQIGEILNNLSEANLLTLIGKVNKGRNNIYALEQLEPYTKIKIDFDEDVIKKYVEDIPNIYGCTSFEIDEKMLKEKNESEYSKNPFGKLKPAPWFMT